MQATAEVLSARAHKAWATRRKEVLEANGRGGGTYRIKEEAVRHENHRVRVVEVYKPGQLGVAS